MKKSLSLTVATCVALAGLCRAQAQAPTSTALPKVIWIFREDVKPARGPMHEKVESDFAQFWKKGNVQPYLGMEAMSGNPTEAVFISGYDSFASFEKDFQAFGKATSGALKADYDTLARQEADLVSAVRSQVAFYREDLSYLGDKFMGAMPQSRYMEILTMRVRLGRDEDFAAGAKLYQNAFKKMKLERPYATYQVTLGAPNGTYFIFAPLKSLKEVDDQMAGEKAFMDAMGAENVKQLQKGAGDVFLFTETNFYAFNPRMSNVTKDFASGDPDFWTPKPKPVTRPASETKK